MDLKVLEEIGLTQGEVKVYLALLRLGVSKAGSLSLAAGVSHSKVYKILGRLQKKGLAGHVLKSGVKHYKAMEPKRILDYLEEKESLLAENKNQISQILPELEKESELAEQKSEATVYDGFKAVTNLIRSILDELKPGEGYCVIGAGYGDNVLGLREFFRLHHFKRAKRKIKLKMLANFNEKETLEPNTGLYSEVRFLPQYLITNMTIYFYKNKVLIALFTREPKGFLVESEEAVKSFEKYFKAFWKIAKA